MQFTAREIETLTGVEPTLQRVWRRRGHIQHRPARNGVQDVAAIMAISALSRLGVAPALHLETVENCSRLVGLAIEAGGNPVRFLVVTGDVKSAPLLRMVHRESLAQVVTTAPAPGAAIVIDLADIHSRMLALIAARETGTGGA